jgi:hypothetical protein
MHNEVADEHALYTHLYDWEDVDKVKTLYLVRLNAVGTLHLGQYAHYLLRKRTANTRASVVSQVTQKYQSIQHIWHLSQHNLAEIKLQHSTETEMCSAKFWCTLTARLALCAYRG